MAKYLVETFYTCTFKVSHYLDKIDEKELENLEKKEDGKFEILDMKIDNRKTKNLEKNLKTVDNLSDKEKQIKKVNKIDDNKNMNNNFVKNLNESVNKRFSMPDRRKGYIQKATIGDHKVYLHTGCLLYTSPSPRD